MTPHKETTPRNVDKIINAKNGAHSKTIERKRYQNQQLDLDNLQRFDEGNGRMDPDRLSIHSGLFTTKAS